MRILAIVAVAAGLVSAADAAAPASASERQVFASMGVEADGYRFDLGIEVGAGPKPAGIGFHRENEAGTEAEGAGYRVADAGSFANRRLAVDLGPFGSARARFVVEDERRNVRRHGKHCAEVTVARRGRFDGRIDVEGENGFAGVHRSRIPGVVRSYRIRGCNRHRVRRPVASAALAAAPAPQRLLRASSLRNPSVTACGTDRGTWFAAFRGPQGTQYGASYETRGDGIHALRFAFSRGTRASFEVSANGRQATIDADTHLFSGTGRYRRSRLTGDLVANLPGQPATPVTPARAWFGDADDIPPGPCFPFGED